MSRPVRGATATALGWNRLYGAGLPEAVRAARRAELASDLYEHAAWDRDAGIDPEDTALVILWRVLAGVPADLSWRLRVARTTSPGVQRSIDQRIPIMFNTLFRRAGIAVIITGALFIAVNGMGLLLAHGDEGWASWYGTGQLVGAALMLGGLVVQRTRVAMGTAMVAVGILIPVTMLYWMLPITVPVAAIGAWALVLRSRALRGAGAAAA